MRRFKHFFVILYRRFISETPRFWAMLVKFGATMSSALIALKLSLLSAMTEPPQWLQNTIDDALITCAVIAFIAQLTTTDRNLSKETP